MTLRVSLDFESRCKSRLLLTLEDGQTAALIVDRGRVLRNGEKVTLTDGREVEIVSAEESLLEATAASTEANAAAIAKAAYHLGNRHVAVQVMPDRLRFQADHVLSTMVEGLGLRVAAVVAAFEPEGGAYGHRHAHLPEMPAVKPKIHSFGE